MGVALAVGIAGCALEGEERSSVPLVSATSTVTTSSEVGSASEEVERSDSTLFEGAEPAPEEPVVGDDVSTPVLMPDLMCLDLQEAQNLMQDLTGNFFAVDSYDASGQGRMQLNDRNWVVVEQDPRPGVSAGAEPRVGAVKDGEAPGCGTAQAAPATRAGGDVVEDEGDGADTGDGLTPSQRNAIRSAQSYLDFTGFSRAGLIDQLSSEFGEQFPIEDATFAVDYLDIDWDEQAARSARSYLDFSGFSRAGLIDQLSSEFGEQFTLDQATRAVDGLDVDWKAEAVESAESYLGFTAFSCQGLIDQLSSEFGEEFTLEEAQHAASAVGLC